MSLALVACGDRSAPSAEENRQLDNAADMLNEAPGVLANVDDNGLTSEKASAINTAG